MGPHRFPTQTAGCPSEPRWIATAKIRNAHVGDDEEDHALPIGAAPYPPRKVMGEAEPCRGSIPMRSCRQLA
jgi:hypothetical protein